MKDKMREIAKERIEEIIDVYEYNSKDPQYPEFAHGTEQGHGFDLFYIEENLYKIFPHTHNSTKGVPQGIKDQEWAMVDLLEKAYEKGWDDLAEFLIGQKELTQEVVDAKNVVDVVVDTEKQEIEKKVREAVVDAMKKLTLNISTPLLSVALGCPDELPKEYKSVPQMNLDQLLRNVGITDYLKGE